MGKFIDLTGQKFERLKAIKRDINVGEAVMWLCRCDCGKEIIVRANALRTNHTKSCGCLHKEIVGRNSFRHGETSHTFKTKEYASYIAMLSRCYNPNDISYPNYGGRGIKVCDEWLNNPEQFIKDMGRKPGNNYSLDRIDVNGNYCLGNTRWATRIEQNNNKRNNSLLENNGEIKTKAEWIRELGVYLNFINHRLSRGIYFPKIIEQAKEYRQKKFIRHWHEDLAQSDFENGY